MHHVADGECLNAAAGADLETPVVVDVVAHARNRVCAMHGDGELCADRSARRAVLVAKCARALPLPVVAFEMSEYP